MAVVLWFCSRIEHREYYYGRMGARDGRGGDLVSIIPFQ